MESFAKHISKSSHWPSWLGLGYLCIFIAGPIAWAVAYSLLYSVGAIGIFRDGLTLKYWRTSLQQGDLTTSLLYTTMLATSTVGLATCVSLGVVCAPQRWRQSRSLILSLCLLLATPSLVLAVMISFMLSSGGAIPRALFHVGFIDGPSQFPALINDPFSIGILLAQTLSAIPLLTLYFLKTWDSAQIDRYRSLALTLGASPLQALIRVVIPMLLLRSRKLLLLIFLLYLGSFEVPLILGRQSPQMFSVYIHRHFGQFDLQQRPQAFVLATTYFLIAGCGVVLYLRQGRSHE